jgi:hypothetical protein
MERLDPAIFSSGHPCGPYPTGMPFGSPDYSLITLAPCRNVITPPGHRLTAER